VEEIPAFVELVGEIVNNGSNLATVIYFTKLLHFKEVEQFIPIIPDKIIKEAENLSRKHNIYILWNQNIKPTKPISFCTRWTEPFILSTGHVQSCCAINEANMREYQKRKSLGNLLKTDFKTIWCNEHKKMRKAIHKGELPEICRYCRAFLHSDKMLS